MDILIYIAPFLLFLILINIFKNKYILTVMYVFIGFFTLVYSDNIIEYSGLIYLVFAYGLNPKLKYGAIILFISFIALTLKMSINNASVIIALQMVFIFSLIFSTVYEIFFREKKKRIDMWNKISEKEKGILKLYMNGKDYAQISKILNIKDKKDSIRTSITRCRNESGCDNDIQFGIWLSDKG